MADENLNSDAMKTAHVLFMDIVAYSRRSIDEQTGLLHILQEIVQGTPQVARAQAAGQLTSIPTGDGMALVFFSEPTAPVECALHVAKALKSHPELQLRMGVHSGPVNEIIDVNGRINVAGTGINMAQRVMDSGDAGHILLSKRVAEDLSQYSRWQPLLHDLSEVEVKHAVRVHLFNLYTEEVGNPASPKKVRKRKARMVMPWIVAAVLAVVMGTAGLLIFSNRNGNRPARVDRPESDYRALLLRKTDAWVDTVFVAQGADGGIKMSVSSGDATTQAWQTAQCLTAVLSARTNLDSRVPLIRRGFEYLEKLHRTTPSEGWNLYDNAIPYTITEIGCWVGIACIRSLDAQAHIWSDVERDDVIRRVLRDLDETNRRQDADGGWRPIRDDSPEFVRTYPTVMAIWLMVEARKSPALAGQMAGKYDDNIRRGINYLLRTYKEKQGWVPNPSRVGQKDRFDGLTAQALFVLSQAETISAFNYMKGDNTYRAARRDFIGNRDAATGTPEANNSRVPDPDLRFVGTDFQAEGSAFLWFPWTLIELARLSKDDSLTEDERRAASQLRRDMLNANADRLESFVETANLIYVLAENLFCVSAYLDAVGN